jgi:hypothetical protein
MMFARAGLARRSARPAGYSASYNFITLLQRGGGTRPCEAPATTVTVMLLVGLQPTAPWSAVLAQGGDPLEPPIRGEDPPDPPARLRTAL